MRKTLTSFVAIAALCMSGLSFAAEKESVAERAGHIALNAVEKSGTYLAEFEKAVRQYTPDVIDAALKVVQINGVQKLITGLLALVLGGGIVFVWYKLNKKFTVKQNTYNDPAFIWCMTGMGISIPVLACVIIAWGTLGNIWNYIAVYEPKLWLAYQLFEKVVE